MLLSCGCVSPYFVFVKLEGGTRTPVPPRQRYSITNGSIPDHSPEIGFATERLYRYNWCPKHGLRPPAEFHHG